MKPLDAEEGNETSQWPRVVEEPDFGSVLVYYFAFPHYRKRILLELTADSGNRVELAAGVSARDEISVLRTEDLPELRELRSVSLGRFTWQSGVVADALSSRYENVIVGPATTSLTTWVILVGRRLTRRRTLLWGQCGRQGEFGLKRYLQEVMNRLASELLVYGSAEKRAATHLGTPAKKVRIVRNATDDNEAYLGDELAADIWSRVCERTESALNEGRIRILFVGRINRSKRIDVLLEALRHLGASYSDISLDLYGAGDDFDRLRQKYSDVAATFHGWEYDPARLREAFECSTIVCSPYHMGLLAVDALRYGVPVLVPDNPQNGSEVEALLDGVNSVRFAPGDSVALARAIRRWLEIAPRVSRDEFLGSRRRSLAEWDPKAVSANLRAALSRERMEGSRRW